MTIDRPWALVLALLPVVWAAWEWRSSSRRLALQSEGGRAGGDRAGAGDAAAHGLSEQSGRRAAGGYIGQYLAGRFDAPNRVWPTAWSGLAAAIGCA